MLERSHLGDGRRVGRQTESDQPKHKPGRGFFEFWIRVQIALSFMMMTMIATSEQRLCGRAHPTSAPAPCCPRHRARCSSGWTPLSVRPEPAAKQLVPQVASAAALHLGPRNYSCSPVVPLLPAVPPDDCCATRAHELQRHCHLGRQLQHPPSSSPPPNQILNTSTPTPDRPHPLPVKLP